MFTREEKIIFDAFIEHKEVLTSDLKSKGIPNSRIQKLVETGVLIRLKRGVYTIDNYDRLYEYGDYLASMGKKEKANTCHNIKRFTPGNGVFTEEEIKIFEIFGNTQSELTAQLLLSSRVGYSSINKFLSDGILKKIGHGFYTIGDLDKFHKYALLLEELGYEEKSKRFNARYLQEIGSPCTELWTVDTIKEGESLDKKKMEKYIKILIHIFIKHNKVTSTILDKSGFDLTRVKTLLDKGILKKKDKTFYFILGSSLIAYAEKCEKKLNTQNAIKAYALCYHANCTTDEIYKVTNHLLNLGEYEKAIQILGKLKDDEKNGHIYRLGLFLLSFVFRMNDANRGYAKKMTLEDIIDDSRSDDSFEREFKELIYNQKFTSAQTLLTQKGEPETLEDRLIQNMLDLAYQKNQKFKTVLREDIEARRLVTARSHLYSEASAHNLIGKHRTYLNIIEEIIRTKETEKVPRVRAPRNNSLTELINTRNFREALSVCKTKAESQNIPPEKNLLYILLDEMVKLCDSLTEKKNPIQTSRDTNAAQKNLKDNSTKKPDTHKNTYNKILELLEEGSSEEALKIIEYLLKSKHREEYLYLISSLIEISYKREPLDFIEPLGTLIKLIRDTFEMDINLYIKEFDECLIQEQYGVARLYLDLLTKIMHANHANITISDFTTIIASLNNRLYEQSHKSLINNPL